MILSSAGWSWLAQHRLNGPLALISPPTDFQFPNTTVSIQHICWLNSLFPHVLSSVLGRWISKRACLSVPIIVNIVYQTFRSAVTSACVYLFCESWISIKLRSRTFCSELIQPPLKALLRNPIKLRHREYTIHKRWEACSHTSPRQGLKGPAKGALSLQAVVVLQKTVLKTSGAQSSLRQPEICSSLISKVWNETLKV